MMTSYRPGSRISQFDIVRVPFPFSDLIGVKNRPALVISSPDLFNLSSDHIVVAMITSAKYSSFPLDVALEKPFDAGLLKPSVVRMKLATLAVSLVMESIGALHASDRQSVIAALKKLIPLNQH